ncbi:hypothetical protein [Falsiroseomonas sp. E2-1-a20]|uniref:hypothetical protein n=1 Tax=Falsiroseomonas sp. E2-1-a20 TaxID=3239300 RepID=UPI003F41239D
MSDTRMPGHTGPTPAGNTPGHMGGTSMGSQSDDAMRRTADEARAAAGTIREEAAGAASDIKKEGAEVMRAARERAEGFAEAQQQAGAEHVDSVARSVHGAADKLGETSPQVAHYVHEAANAMEGIGRTLRESTPGELLGRVEDIARRQPVAFFGAAVLAGFALVRFAKSSADASRRRTGSDAGEYAGGYSDYTGRRVEHDNDHRAGAVSQRPVGAGGAPGWVPPATPGANDAHAGGHTGDASAPARPATLAAASLGGAAAWPGGKARDTDFPERAG